MTAFTGFQHHPTGRLFRSRRQAMMFAEDWGKLHTGEAHAIVRMQDGREVAVGDVRKGRTFNQDDNAKNQKSPKGDRS